VIGVLLLKEMNDLTDAETVGALDYDLRWQVALDLEPEEAHVCQKTPHNFRAKVMARHRGRLLFERMTARIIHALGVSTERRRPDSGAHHVERGATHAAEAVSDTAGPPRPSSGRVWRRRP
jgi:hypothetical protein